MKSLEQLELGLSILSTSFNNTDMDTGDEKEYFVVGTAYNDPVGKYCTSFWREERKNRLISSGLSVFCRLGRRGKRVQAGSPCRSGAGRSKQS